MVSNYDENDYGENDVRRAHAAAVFARLPHVREAVAEMRRQTNVYGDVVARLSGLSDGVGIRRMFAALHGLLPLSAMAPEEIGAAWARFVESTRDDDDPYPAHQGLRRGRLPLDPDLARRRTPTKRR